MELTSNNYSDISQHYDSVSNLYDNETNQNFYSFFARNLTNEIKQTNMKFNNVLEIGCGSGISTLELLKLIEPIKVKAVDISKNMLDKAKLKKELQGVRFYSDFKEIKDEKFDLIFSSFSYHWWDDSLIKMLSVILDRNGTIALCVPARKPDLSNGNIFITNAIRKIRPKINNQKKRTIGLTKKKLFDDISVFNNRMIQFKTIKLTEKFTDFREFINTLEVRGALLALSKYYRIDIEEIKNELHKNSAKVNNPIEISWKAYSVVVNC